jgi:energy-coupling factor transporter ATP-binding protein EcfA2
MSLPVTTVDAAFKTCNPVESLAADDERYVDFSAARGDDGMAASLCRRRIERSDVPLVQLLAGHRGCGKSTELRQLQQALINSGFVVALVDAETDIDIEDTEPVDILLSFIRGLEDSLREQKIKLDQKTLESLHKWFAETVVEETARASFELEVKSEAELKGGIPFFASLMTKLTGMIKRGTDSKTTVRQKLEPRLSQLLDRGALLFQKARDKVRKQGKRDLVLIVDGLDRISLKEKPNGLTSHEWLFIERGELFKGFGCHIVLTVPISLMFSARSANLSAVFPDHQVLPMIKINNRDGSRYEQGRALLEMALSRRVDLKQVFEDGVVDLLIETSGGHPRQLMLLVRYAIDFVDENPVTMKAAKQAVRKLMHDYDRSVPRDHWPLLAEVARTKAVQNDGDHQLMLYNLSVLEYQNDARWCDVNPSVRDLPQFVKAAGPKKKKSATRKKAARRKKAAKPAKAARRKKASGR